MFARGYDQSQWSHAFGIGIVGAEFPETDHDDYQLHEWYFGTPPPDLNTTGIVEGDVDLLFTGVQLAGPHLTVANFSAGLQRPAGATGIGATGCGRSSPTASTASGPGVPTTAASTT